MRTAGAVHRLTTAVPYRWHLVAALSITETISWGIVYYGFPVFLQPMEQSLGASRVGVTGAFSLALAVSSVAALPVGRWLDRYGPRALMTAGSCLATVLLWAWSRVTSLGALYLVWGLMGLAMAAILYEPAFAAIVQWFPRHRDRALLAVTLAAGLASTIFMPLAAWLLGRIGWRLAVQVLGGFLALTTIPVHAAVLRPPPRSPESSRAPAGPRSARAPLAGVLATPAFWALAGAFTVGIFSTVTVSVHLIPFLTQQGYPPTSAAAVVGWIGAMQIPGRLLFVPATAWASSHVVAGILFLLQACAMVLLPMATSPPRLILVTMLLGATNGMATLVRATIVAELFGRERYATISGAIAVGVNGARALGPVGASLLRLWLGGYGNVFRVLSVALAVVGVALLGVLRRGRPEQRSAR